MKHSPLRASLVLLLLAASFCSAASSDVLYRKALQSALDRQPALCLGETTWPVSIPDGRDLWINAKMEALVDAGLIAPHHRAGRKIWQLTDYGRAEYRRHHDFCYGQMRVRKIEQISLRDDKTIVLTFTYYLASLPKWASNRSVRVANTDLDNLLMGINSVRYQASFVHQADGSLQLLNEPEQRDLDY